MPAEGGDAAGRGDVIADGRMWCLVQQRSDSGWLGSAALGRPQRSGTTLFPAQPLDRQARSGGDCCGGLGHFVLGVEDRPAMLNQAVSGLEDPQDVDFARLELFLQPPQGFGEFRGGDGVAL